MNSGYKASKSFRIALAVSATTIAFVLYVQYYMGVPPCHLCLDERLPWYALVVVLAFASYATRGGRVPVSTQALFVVAAGLFACSLCLGAYHLGMEKGWWHGDIACAAGADQGQEFSGLMDRFMNATAIPCDKPAMFVFGVSLAGWNAILSGAMLLDELVSLSRYRNDRKAEAQVAIVAATTRTAA